MCYLQYETSSAYLSVCILKIITLYETLIENMVI